MTEEQFKSVKYGDILLYHEFSGAIVKAKVKSCYRFAGGGRISADIIDDCEYSDCDAPISCFEIIC